jgi:hypothetical protein
MPVAIIEANQKRFGLVYILMTGLDEKKEQT